jgi:hypothetical protein
VEHVTMLEAASFLTAFGSHCARVQACVRCSKILRIALLKKERDLPADLRA